MVVVVLLLLEAREAREAREEREEEEGNGEEEGKEGHLKGCWNSDLLQLSRLAVFPSMFPVLAFPSPLLSPQKKNKKEFLIQLKLVDLELCLKRERSWKL